MSAPLMRLHHPRYCQIKANTIGSQMLHFLLHSRPPQMHAHTKKGQEAFLPNLECRVVLNLVLWEWLLPTLLSCDVFQFLRCRKTNFGQHITSDTTGALETTYRSIGFRSKERCRNNIHASAGLAAAAAAAFARFVGSSGTCWIRCGQTNTSS